MDPSGRANLHRAVGGCRNRSRAAGWWTELRPLATFPPVCIATPRPPPRQQCRRHLRGHYRRVGSRRTRCPGRPRSWIHKLAAMSVVTQYLERHGSALEVLPRSAGRHVRPVLVGQASSRAFAAGTTSRRLRSRSLDGSWPGVAGGSAGEPAARQRRQPGMVLVAGVARHVAWAWWPAWRLLPVDPGHGGLQQVVMVAAGGLGEEGVDLFLRHPGLAQGSGGAAQDSAVPPWPAPPSPTRAGSCRRSSPSRVSLYTGCGAAIGDGAGNHPQVPTIRRRRGRWPATAAGGADKQLMSASDSARSAERRGAGR